MSEPLAGKPRTRLISFFVVWLSLGLLTMAQAAPKTHVRFFNDSAKAASFYIDSQFGCSIPANPQENNAYCDAEISLGEHSLMVKGVNLSSQSCKVYVAIGNTEKGAEAHLSKGERFRCFSFISHH